MTWKLKVTSRPPKSCSRFSQWPCQWLSVQYFFWCTRVVLCLHILQHHSPVSSLVLSGHVSSSCRYQPWAGRSVSSVAATVSLPLLLCDLQNDAYFSPVSCLWTVCFIEPGQNRFSVSLHTGLYNINTSTLNCPPQVLWICRQRRLTWWKMLERFLSWIISTLPPESFSPR